jgi:hypothetical protein
MPVADAAGQKGPVVFNKSLIFVGEIEKPSTNEPGSIEMGQKRVNLTPAVMWPILKDGTSF